MAVVGTPPDVVGGGEYGATTVRVTADGDALRIAFGRNGLNGSKIFYGAVLLTKEAAEELITQLGEIGRAG